MIKEELFIERRDLPGGRAGRVRVRFPGPGAAGKLDTGARIGDKDGQPRAAFFGRVEQFLTRYAFAVGLLEIMFAVLEKSVPAPVNKDGVFFSHFLFLQELDRFCKNTVVGLISVVIRPHSAYGEFGPA